MEGLNRAALPNLLTYAGWTLNSWLPTVSDVSDRVSQDLGIEKGDVIVQVNRVPIDNAQDVAKVFDALSGRDVVRMYFERGGRIYSTDFMIR